MAVKVTFSGPAFDGRGQQVMNDIVEATTIAIGQHGEREVHANLRGSLRNPTGAYQQRITLYTSAGRGQVHDRQGVYGPWLEGTGSRNKTTRFKGYASFRRATQQLDRQAKEITERVIREHLAKLGG